MAHDDISGKPFVQPRAMGLGLAGWLLAELMLAGHIGLWQEQIVVAPGPAPEEALAAHVLLAREREHGGGRTHVAC